MTKQTLPVGSARYSKRQATVFLRFSYARLCLAIEQEGTCAAQQVTSKKASRVATSINLYHKVNVKVEAHEINRRARSWRDIFPSVMSKQGEYYSVATYAET